MSDFLTILRKYTNLYNKHYLFHYVALSFFFLESANQKNIV